MTENYEGPPQTNPWGTGPPAATGGDPNPIRLCRRCSAQSQTDGTHCPHCGASFVRRHRVSKRTALVASAATVVIIAAAGALIVVRHDRNQADAKHREQAAA